MALYHLVPHPAHPPASVSGVAVEVARNAQTLTLRSRVAGAAALVLPAPQSARRTDGLWRTTCFELFATTGGEGYTEFNFSPSTQWAAYRFDGYRNGMAPLDRDVAPVIERLEDGIEVDCDLGGLPPGGLRIGLSAVIEEQGGVKSFWALAHPPEGPPDFHHPACFAAMLPAGAEA